LYPIGMARVRDDPVVRPARGCYGDPALPLEFSVVVPTLGRHEELARCLDALGAQRDSPPFEVLVVDDPGDDRVSLGAVIGERPFPCRQLTRDAPGVSAARNKGWREALASLVLFIGDDVLAAPHLVAEHAAWHESHPVDEVGVLGHTEWARELDITPFMHWLDRGQQFDYGGIEGVDAGAGRLYTSNVSLKRAILDRVGGFDEDFVFGYEDIELGFRLSKLGFRLLYNSRARAEHLHRVTPEEWGRRMTAVAAGERLLVDKHPEITPRLYETFRRAAAAPPARGRAARLVRIVPPSVPWLGRTVWTSAQQRWLQQLAPAFLSAWDAAGEELGGPPDRREQAASDFR
jgi:GT2 family glycosyltransferase